MKKKAQWGIQDSLKLYNIPGWGAGYFDINEKGNIVVRPHRNTSAEIDVKALLDHLLSIDVQPPVLLRFSDIIGDRIDQLCTAFQQSFQETGYQGDFIAVYPVKVNQQRQVVEEVLRYGQKQNIGLEAGSKPELHAVLSVLDNPRSVVICNGYKDRDFLELAVLAQKMERNVFVVIEKLNELEILQQVSAQQNIIPQIGIRLKLSTTGSGRWAQSGGEGSKFGLNAAEVLQVIDFAQQNNWIHNIRLIHFHIGSQITNIHTIKTALREIASYYVQLRKAGCPIAYVNVGGGLGVDYDGTHSDHQNSINYSIQEYADDIVYTLYETCKQYDLPHPNIIAESGRAMTAHHSVLIVNVLEQTSPPIWQGTKIREDDHPILTALYETLTTLDKDNLRESWHDAQQLKQEMFSMFHLGLIDLRTRAVAEQLFWTIARKVYEFLQTEQIEYLQEELLQIKKQLTSKYFCNFSIFQSLPDSWAIDQLFPVVPIHRLNEQPTVLATLEDITCDSDGRLDLFVQYYNHTPYIALHPLRKDEPYYIGIFLVGAYQEILGDLHNLFGDTNIVHIRTRENGYVISQILDGETVADVLEYVEFDPKELARRVERWVHQSIQTGKISEQQGREFLAIYRSGLHSYTYLQQIKMPENVPTPSPSVR